MKKIVKQTGNIRLTGRAEKNGVAFSAAKDFGPVGVSSPGVFAAVDENSEITCSRYNSYPPNSRIDSKIDSLSKTTRKVAWILFSIFFVAYLVFGIIQTGFENVFFILSYIMLSVTALKKAVTISLARVFGNEEIKSFSKFLAAKNAVQNAYYDLKKIPSIDEAKKYSIFSFTSEYITPYDAAFATWVIPYSIICHSIPFPLLLLLALFIVMVIVTLTMKHMLFFWQFLILSKPENIHYEAALKALSESVTEVDSVEMHVTSFEISGNHERKTFSEEKCKGCEFYDLCKEIMDSVQEDDDVIDAETSSTEE